MTGPVAFEGGTGSVARNDLRDDAYDPNDIYMGGAKDAQGHSTNIRAHIPDTWVGMINQIVSSPLWPEYQTFQDFYRDAIYQRMRWAQRQPNRGNDPKVRALMAIINSQASLNYASTVRQAAEEQVNAASRTLSQMVADGNSIAVRETIKELEANLTDLPEPWRSRLAAELETWERRIAN